MGWGRLLLLGNLGQQLDINDQKAEIENLRDEIRNSRMASPDSTSDSGRLTVLQAENDELRLYLTAVVRLLTSKGLVSPEEMRQMVQAIDGDDGLPDSRYKGVIE